MIFIFDLVSRIESDIERIWYNKNRAKMHRFGLNAEMPRLRVAVIPS